MLLVNKVVHKLSAYYGLWACKDVRDSKKMALVERERSMWTKVSIL